MIRIRTYEDHLYYPFYIHHHFFEIKGEQLNKLDNLETSMTKKELKQKMVEFIERQNEFNKEEWYISDKALAAYIIVEFANDLGIDLKEYVGA